VQVHRLHASGDGLAWRHPEVIFINRRFLEAPEGIRSLKILRATRRLTLEGRPQQLKVPEAQEGDVIPSG
jgi:hypothetical protein